MAASYATICTTRRTPTHGSDSCSESASDSRNKPNSKPSFGTTDWLVAHTKCCAFSPPGPPVAVVSGLRQGSDSMSESLSDSSTELRSTSMLSASGKLGAVSWMLSSIFSTTAVLPIVAAFRVDAVARERDVPVVCFLEREELLDAVRLLADRFRAGLLVVEVLDCWELFLVELDDDRAGDGAGDEDIYPDVDVEGYAPSSSSKPFCITSRSISLWLIMSRSLLFSSVPGVPCSISLSIRMYFIANRSVVIFVSFSLDAALPPHGGELTGELAPLVPATATGTARLKFSNALLISRMRLRSRAFAVFRRYLLRGAALGLGFSFGAAFSLVVVVVVLVEDLLTVAAGSCVVRRDCRCRSEYFSSFLISDTSDPAPSAAIVWLM
uniref:Uncharacterized protein n=1 Tax=Anopheles farauti TaxID=69004 RepID=A0A182QJ82_9DIPT